ncbi:MAG: hypothetical protein ACYSUD_13815 [Planctomycetota bacterium]
MKNGLMLTAFLCLLLLCHFAAAADTEQKLLGDESDGSLAHPVHLIPLVAEEGDQIGPDDDPLLPFSTKQTCGGVCHSYDVIGSGWHFNAADANVAPGRPGQPWILADGRTWRRVGPVSRGYLPTGAPALRFRFRFVPGPVRSGPSKPA